MTGSELRISLVGLMTMNLAVPVQGISRRWPWGGGGGGFHGGGMAGGFHGAVRRRRLRWLSWRLRVAVTAAYHGGYAAPSFNRTPSFTMPHTVSAMPRSEFGERQSRE